MGTDQIEQGAAERLAMQGDLGQLRKMIEDVAVQFETLREVLAQETEQRCAAEASALDGFKELQQMLHDESQDRASSDDEISRTLKDMIDDDRTSQNQSQAALRNQISSLHKDLATHKQELPVLRTRIEETEAVRERPKVLDWRNALSRSRPLSSKKLERDRRWQRKLSRCSRHVERSCGPWSPNRQRQAGLRESSSNA